MYDGEDGDAGDGRRRPRGRGPSSSGGWNEVQGDPQVYDPSPRPASQQGWDDWASPQYQQPGPRVDRDPRYRFTPPPASYPAYPPPYAYPYPYPPYMQPHDPMRNKKMPVVGGVLCIISGSVGLFWLIPAWGSGGSLWFGGEFWFCVVIQLVLSILAIIGGIFAMMRRMFAIAIIGAICAILAGGILFAITFTIGLLALILIAIGKESFQRSGPPQGQYY